MISYQKKYQINKLKDGLCKTCGKRKVYKWGMCRMHYTNAYIAQKEYQASHKEDQRKRCAEFRRKNPDYFKEWYIRNRKK